VHCLLDHVQNLSSISNASESNNHYSAESSNSHCPAFINVINPNIPDLVREQRRAVYLLAHSVPGIMPLGLETDLRHFTRKVQHDRQYPMPCGDMSG
jgi:hypothetical protein